MEWLPASPQLPGAGQRCQGTWVFSKSFDKAPVEKLLERNNPPALTTLFSHLHVVSTLASRLVKMGSLKSPWSCLVWGRGREGPDPRTSEETRQAEAPSPRDMSTAQDWKQGWWAGQKPRQATRAACTAPPWHDAASISSRVSLNACWVPASPLTVHLCGPHSSWWGE